MIGFCCETFLFYHASMVGDTADILAGHARLSFLFAAQSAYLLSNECD